VNRPLSICISLAKSGNRPLLICISLANQATTHFRFVFLLQNETNCVCLDHAN